MSGVDLGRAERVAAELARIAGAEIEARVGTAFSVAYKDDDPAAARDPVSEVDQDVERIVRARLADEFPGHDVVGEESEHRPGRGHDWVWAIDPIDGTTNFVNGVPLFSATMGVLHRGEPVAGAVWCSATHALRPGVYSAHRGGPLCFDGAVHTSPERAAKRRVAGMPSLREEAPLPFDLRKTGSAALECAWVAAGVLTACRFRPLNVWDVAGGIALARSVGLEVWTDASGEWTPFERFEPASRDGVEPDLRYWRGQLAIGTGAALAAAREAG